MSDVTIIHEDGTETISQGEYERIEERIEPESNPDKDASCPVVRVWRTDPDASNPTYEDFYNAAISTAMADSAAESVEPELETVDIRFTPAGISISAYSTEATVLEEYWRTWSEVRELRSRGESHMTIGNSAAGEA